MIVTTNVTVNGKELVKTVSDSGVKIRKVGTDEVYTDAYDVPDSGFTYEETAERVITAEERAALRSARRAVR